jgi:hypothetical protein
MVVTYIIPDFIPLMINLDGRFSDSNITIEIDNLSRVMITVDLTERQILRYAEN